MDAGSRRLQISLALSKNRIVGTFGLFVPGSLGHAFDYLTDSDRNSLSGVPWVLSETWMFIAARTPAHGKERSNQPISLNRFSWCSGGE